MKFTLVAVLAGLCAFALASPVYEEQQGGYHHYKVGGKDYLRQYKDVLTLFKYVHQPTHLQEHVTLAKEYNVHHNLADYT
ncbi:hypothetical protein ILUMI_17347, partial [Ignelater luminosus]